MNPANETKNKMSSAADASSGKQDTRMVKLRRNSPNSKLGFSLRGGKEATGSSVGVFVSHVEHRGEAHKKGLKLGDQLVRVDGLDVNRATYDEVITIIKQRAATKTRDILLEVRGGKLIPFQEKSGQPIKWLQVQQDEDTCSSSSSSSSISISASDEGVDSCESTDARSWPTPDTKQLDQQHNSKQVTGSLSDGNCCSISISSLSSSGAGNSASSATCCRESQSSESEAEEGAEVSEPETEIRVPGGQQTRESFGCGVVKGPDEWPGIFVQNVRAGSLAERVGLEAGDQLLEADGRKLGELAFESAIKLIKRLQQEQSELVLLVRKGAALRHLARQQSIESSSATWSAPGSRSREAETSGASPESPSCRSLSSGEEDAAAPRHRNPISGTQNQQTKQRTLDADKNNNDSLRADDANGATTAGGSADRLQSWSCRSGGGGKQEATRESGKSPKMLDAASDCRGCRQRKRSQTADSRRESDCSSLRRDEDEGEDEDDEEEGDVVERIRIVSQNCKLHHQRGRHKHLTMKQQVPSVVVREKFPQLASVETNKQTSAGAETARPFVKNRYLQQRAAAGMQRYVSMDNLCASQQQQQQPTPRQVQKISSRRGSHYASPIEQQVSSAEQQRFAHQIQQYNRRRSSSVLGEPVGITEGQCLVGCCPTMRRLAADCCRPATNWPPARTHPPPPMSPPLQHALGYASSTLANCQMPSASRPLHYRAQSVDKLNRAASNLCAYQVTTNRYATRTLIGPPPTSVAASRLRRLQMLQSRSPREDQRCVQCHQQQQLATPAAMLSSAATRRLISQQAAPCCSPQTTQQSRLLAKKTTSISHLNLHQEESIYLTACCLPPAPLPNAGCCCGYQRSRSRTSRGSPRSHNGDSSATSGYLSSSAGSMQCAARQAVARPQPRHNHNPRPKQLAPPPPPMITMEMARKQHRDPRIMSTFVSSSAPKQPKQQLISSTSAESDFSSFSPANSSPSSGSSSVQPPPTTTTTASSADSSLLSNGSHAGSGSADKKKPPQPPPLPLPDADFECRLNTLKALTTTAAAGAATTVKSESVPKRKSSEQQLERLCFVDELKMLAQRGQQQSPSSADQALNATTATLFKTLRASKQQQAGGGKPTSRTGACRLHDQKASAKKNDKLNEEDNKRRQHELLMKEFKSAHSRMFNKRRTSTCADGSPVGQLSGGSAATTDLAPPVNNRNCSPRQQGNAPAANNDNNNNNCATKKGSISVAVGLPLPLQQQTAN